MPLSNTYRDTDVQVYGHRQHNRLLSSLPDPLWQRLLPHLSRVDLPSGKVLGEPGQPVSHVCFPTSAVVSLQASTSCGSLSQIAMVGSEGLVGMSLLTGGGSMPHGAVVCGAGAGFRIAGGILKTEFDRGGAGTYLLLRYLQTLMMQMAGNAACNRYHLIEGQLCRLLLMQLDRLPGCELSLTHEQMSEMLGVRREGVSEHAFRLQRDGLIRYARGHISVLDRSALESRACACYAASRLLKQPSPAVPAEVRCPSAAWAQLAAEPASTLPLHAMAVEQRVWQ